MRAGPRRAMVMLAILAAIAASYCGAFLLRFEFLIPPAASDLFRTGLICMLLIQGSVFWLFGLHANRWRVAGVFDLWRIWVANVTASALASVALYFWTQGAFPLSIVIVDGLLCLLLIGGLQFAARLIREVLQPSAVRTDKTRTVLIYGAGDAGLQLCREIRTQKRLEAVVVGFLDDDHRKRRQTIGGLPILGTGRDAASVVTRLARRGKPVSEIVIALPSATGAEMRTAIANCRASGLPFKTLPSVSELLDGRIIRQVRDVTPEDLLGRDAVSIEEDRIEEAIAGRTVLVTGGCGSIGSEICRQVARFHPRRLVVFDQAESEIFMLAMNLRGWHADLDLVTEIGDVTSAARVNEVMSRHRVDFVFHAAAYKHVPLMEENILEAVHNNVIGTYNVALAAQHHGVSKFVLISTDKAVNPTSVMGLTKRVAELLVSSMSFEDDAGRFVSVRFGNVLGSSGSVVQIFRRQIAAGGPVTITHPEMRRYFMSISEAVQLVLQASTMGEGSEVFVLDMGQPMLVMELARNMIRLAGLVPDEDIPIRITGLRPGEKLFEEICLEDENHLPTCHQKIRRFQSRILGSAFMAHWLESLRAKLRVRDVEAILEQMLTIVPEYQGIHRRSVKAMAAGRDGRRAPKDVVEGTSSAA